jgi:hypothetical protein
MNNLLKKIGEMANLQKGINIRLPEKVMKVNPVLAKFSLKI